MLYNEDEVKRICEKYGIETVEKEGYPIYMGEEMDENFSFSEMMRQPITFKDDIITLSSETITLSLPICVEPLFYNNCYPSEYENKISCEKECDFDKITSSIPYDNQNKFAA